RVADGLDHPPALLLDGLLQQLVALAHHHQPGNVAMLLEVGSRALDVGEHDGDFAPEFLQLRQHAGVHPRRGNDLGNAVLRFHKAAAAGASPQPAKPGRLRTWRVRPQTAAVERLWGPTAPRTTGSPKADT